MYSFRQNILIYINQGWQNMVYKVKKNKDLLNKCMQSQLILIIDIEQDLRLKMDYTKTNHIKGYQTYNCQKIMISQLPDLMVYEDPSQIRLKTLQDFSNISLISSLSSNQRTYTHHQDRNIYNFSDFSYIFEAPRVEDIHIQNMGLFRGTSESVECYEKREGQSKLYLTMLKEHQQVEVDQMNEYRGENNELKEDSSFLSQPKLEQEFQSKVKMGDLSNSSQCSYKIQSKKVARGLKVTKNVTKNMGKLLFKFIWKHRRTLGDDLKVEQSRWQAFITVISAWKKQNNITRQYLINKWHRNNQHSALFRIISQHYFRKRCLPAIMKSNIGLKRIHYQRIRRFSSAITDASALDSIA